VKLTVLAHSDDEYLDIRVKDTGPGIPGLEEGQLPGSGVGLQNVRDRLNNMYGDDYSLQLTSDNGGGLCVRIRLPAIRDLPQAQPEMLAQSHG
jgi:two-component system sensor histidine kinase YesM